MHEPTDTGRTATPGADRRGFLLHAGAGEFTPQGGSPLTTTHPTLPTNAKFMNLHPFNDIGTIAPRALLFISRHLA